MSILEIRVAVALFFMLAVGCSGRAAPRASDSAAAPARADSMHATASPTLPADSTPGPIPLAFRGTWDRNTDACRAASSEMRLRVGADSLHFYEGTGAVLRVVPIVSDGGQIVRIETRHEAEGTVDRRAQTLDRRGDSLWVKIGSDSTVRVRCTSAAP